MKKLLLFLFTIAVLFMPTIPSFAISETRYLRVIDSETGFYSNENENSFLFYLPYSYYVKVLEIKENFLHVELVLDNAPSLDGYVKKDALYEDGQEVLSPYPSITLSTISNCTFYKDKNCSNPIMYIFENRHLIYYGTCLSSDNEHVYYVSYNQKLGYVKETDVSPFTISTHPNKLTFLESEPISPETAITVSNDEITEEKDNSTIKLVIVIILMLAGVLALFVAIFPKKPKREENYYDENDFI